MVLTDDEIIISVWKNPLFLPYATKQPFELCIMLINENRHNLDHIKHPTEEMFFLAKYWFLSCGDYEYYIRSKRKYWKELQKTRTSRSPYDQQLCYLKSIMYKQH